jgi:hypothetical protein
MFGLQAAASPLLGGRERQGAPDRPGGKARWRAAGRASSPLPPCPPCRPPRPAPHPAAPVDRTSCGKPSGGARVHPGALQPGLCCAVCLCCACACVGSVTRESSTCLPACRGPGLAGLAGPAGAGEMVAVRRPVQRAPSSPSSPHRTPAEHGKCDLRTWRQQRGARGWGQGSLRGSLRLRAGTKSPLPTPGRLGQRRVGVRGERPRAALLRGTWCVRGSGQGPGQPQSCQPCQQLPNLRNRPASLLGSPPTPGPPNLLLPGCTTCVTGQASLNSAWGGPWWLGAGAGDWGWPSADAAPTQPALTTVPHTLGTSHPHLLAHIHAPRCPPNSATRPALTAMLQRDGTGHPHQTTHQQQHLIVDTTTSASTASTAGARSAAAPAAHGGVRSLARSTFANARNSRTRRLPVHLTPSHHPFQKKTRRCREV